MKQLSSKGFYKIDKNTLRKIKNIFYSKSVNANNTKKTIKMIYKYNNKILDPHSSVGFRALEDGIGASSWFCDPSAPWQKGTVENTNKRLRRYLPGNTDLMSVSQRDLTTLARHLNNQPRKCLGYETPAEVLVMEGLAQEALGRDAEAMESYRLAIAKGDAPADAATRIVTGPELHSLYTAAGL